MQGYYYNRGTAFACVLIGLDIRLGSWSRAMLVVRGVLAGQSRVVAGTTRGRRPQRA